MHFLSAIPYQLRQALALTGLGHAGSCGIIHQDCALLGGITIRLIVDFSERISGTRMSANLSIIFMSSDTA